MCNVISLNQKRVEKYNSEKEKIKRHNELIDYINEVGVEQIMKDFEEMDEGIIEKVIVENEGYREELETIEEVEDWLMGTNEIIYGKFRVQEGVFIWIEEMEQYIEVI